MPKITALKAKSLRMKSACAVVLTSLCSGMQLSKLDPKMCFSWESTTHPSQFGRTPNTFTENIDLSLTGNSQLNEAYFRCRASDFLKKIAANERGMRLEETCWMHISKHYFKILSIWGSIATQTHIPACWEHHLFWQKGELCSGMTVWWTKYHCQIYI